jgi:uncharacterized DUF497 family protein
MIEFDNSDPTKAAKNLRDHGVTFEEGETVFRDAANLSVIDSVSDPSEERFVMVGMSSHHLSAQGDGKRTGGIQQLK